MLFSSLGLSSDSLIVAIALSTVLTPRHMAPLVILFGICDAGASMISPAIAVQMPMPSLAPIFLLLWGGLVIVNLPSVAHRCRSVFWAYLLPPLLSIDNLVVPSDAPVAAGLVSSAMAAVGFGVGIALLCSCRPRAPRDRWVGAALAGAGLLLTA
jgi:hypothetical protein